MVRKSYRQQVIDRLDDITVTVIKQYYRSTLLGIPSYRSEELLFRCRNLRLRLRNRRYLFQRGSYRKREPKFELYLCPDHVDGLNEREFLFHFRLSRDSFWQLVQQIKNHPNFHRHGDARGKVPRPAEHQLLVLLKYYGSEGNAASNYNLSAFFGISHGAVDSCKDHALEALLTLEKHTYFWPNEAERQQISSRIKASYLFPNCVGIIDGTLLPLASRPLLHGENYLSRKRFYALVMLVVCDDQKRILYYHVGWPGSVHDNRVWRTCRLFRKCATMFSSKEYLLGDSAFTASDIMIPPFKSTPGNELPSNQSAFNTLLAKPRVKSEHCIGLLKGRFPFLKGIRLMLGNKIHLTRIINHVRGNVVLHNFLVGDPVDPEWIVTDEGGDDLDPEPASSNSNQPDGQRRAELMYYLSELEETTIN
jgi:DDE superfamily endonuclease